MVVDTLLLISKSFTCSVFSINLLCDATSHRGLKIKKSASGAAGSRDGAVMTQNIDGSM
jgi:hypothetical protein